MLWAHFFLMNVTPGTIKNYKTVNKNLGYFSSKLQILIEILIQNMIRLIVNKNSYSRIANKDFAA